MWGVCAALRVPGGVVRVHRDALESFLVVRHEQVGLQFQAAIKDDHLTRGGEGNDFNSHHSLQVMTSPHPFSHSPLDINIYILVLGVLIEIKLNLSLRVRQQFR